MKYIIYFWILLSALSGYSQGEVKGEFKIQSIDTISYYYVIKVKSIDTDNVSIMLSPKISNSISSHLIKIDGIYYFELEPTRILKYSDKEGDQLILPLRNFYIDGILICTYKELPFLSRNLEGLSYKKN